MQISFFRGKQNLFDFSIKKSMQSNMAFLSEIISASQRPSAFEHPHFRNLSIIESRLKIGILVFYQLYPHLYVHLLLSIHSFHKKSPITRHAQSRFISIFTPYPPIIPYHAPLVLFFPLFPIHSLGGGLSSLVGWGWSLPLVCCGGRGDTFKKEKSQKKKEHFITTPRSLDRHH